MTVQSVLSVQEQRLIHPPEDRTVPGHERASRILHSFQNQRPKIDVERARLFTESFRQTEGEALILRWSKALLHTARHITVYIDEDQLIAGRGGYPGRYGILYPELDGDYLDTVIKDLPSRGQSPFDLTEEDSAIIVNEISPYWKGKTFHEALAKALPAETLKVTYDPEDPLKSRFIVNETASFRSSIQWVHDYEKVLRIGYKGIKEEALREIEQLDPYSPVDHMEKLPFLQAIVNVSDAIVLWANRHSRLAAELADKEKNPVRQAELRKIAEISAHVPEYPPRSFHEAVQSQWFVQMFSRLEQKTGTVISNGRMDQYLYPFYQQDIQLGRITDQEVIELLECVWNAMAQFLDLYISPTGGAFNEGYAHWEAVTVGGQTPGGLDATNELTYLMLQSKREFPLNYPDLAARIHTRSPERYLYEVAETIKEGSGFPKLINDEEVVPLLLAKGATFEEAYDYAVSGCAECRMPNRDTYTSPCAYINFAAAVEMTLRNGQMLRYPGETLGLETGDPVSFGSWEQFFDAY